MSIREGQPLSPTISFDDWRAEQRAGGSTELAKAHGKGKGKSKGKGGSKLAGPKPADDDVDALVASIEAAASEAGALQPDDAEDAAAAAELSQQPPATPPAAAAAASKLSGRRVRICGLAARPELNGRCGVARRFDVGKGRYEVVVEGEEEPLLLKPASLQDVVDVVDVVEAVAPEPAAAAAAEAAAEKAGGAKGGDTEAVEREAARVEVVAKVAAARAAQALGEAARLARHS